MDGWFENNFTSTTRRLINRLAAHVQSFDSGAVHILYNALRGEGGVAICYIALYEGGGVFADVI